MRGVDETRHLPGRLGAEGLNWTKATEDDLESRAGYTELDGNQPHH
jgi:hypothetical protein